MLQLASGARVDRYTVLRPIGAGGLATVYLARHDQIGSLHALKVLTVPTRAVRDRLLQEGRVQGVLRHPNLVAVTDVVEVDAAPALVLEYVSGPSLAAFLARTRPTLAQVAALARGILRGVAAAHREGLVHRDLKPANVLLEIGDGEVVPKVTDFGLAKLLANPAGDGVTRSGVTMGTPAYMAPEQVRDSGNVDARADVFALGAVLYELCTGRRAFVGGDSFEVLQAVAAVRYAPLDDAELPSSWREAITRALSADPADRFADAQELGAAWARGAPSVPPDASVWDDDALALATTLGSGEHARISSAPPPSADTVALSEVSSPAPEPAEAGRGTTAVAALAAAAAGLPFLYGATTAMVPEAPALLGARYAAVLALGVATLAAVGAIADVTLRRRATVPLWGWFLAPAAFGAITQAMTFGVTIPLDERPGVVSERAMALSHGLQVATALDCAAQIVLALVFGAIAALGATAVLAEARLPRRVEPRQLAIGAVALVGGSAVWMGAMWHASGGPLPFLVFVVLCCAAIDLAASTRTPPPDADVPFVRRSQLLVLLATVASVVASAKAALLDEQLYLFAAVVAEAPMDRFVAAEQNAQFDPLASGSIFAGWLAVSLTMGLVAVKVELRRSLRPFVRELAGAFALAGIVLSIDVAAFGGRMRGADALLPAFLEESIAMQVGLSVHEDEDEGVVTVDLDQGGLRRGDVVRYVQGRQVLAARDLAVASRECGCGTPTAASCDPCLEPGDPLRIAVDRDGRKVEVDVPRVR